MVVVWTGTATGTNRPSLTDVAFTPINPSTHLSLSHTHTQTLVDEYQNKMLDAAIALWDLPLWAPAGTALDRVRPSFACIDACMHLAASTH